MNKEPVEASRIRAPGWRDPRLIVGIILVLLSITGVVALIQAMDAREGYWAASVDIVPGAEVSAEDFHIVQASMSESSDRYWIADDQLPSKFLVSSTIRQGEMLPVQDVKTRTQTGANKLAFSFRRICPRRFPLVPGRTPGWHWQVLTVVVSKNRRNLLATLK